MPGWTDLKLWMAVCWKVSWNVDPLALRVPERAALVLVEEVLGVELVDEDPHAAARRAVATRTTPVVVTRLIRKSCML